MPDQSDIPRSSDATFRSRKAKAAAKLARTTRRGIELDPAVAPLLLERVVDTPELRARFGLDRGLTARKLGPGARRTTHKERTAFPDGVEAYLDEHSEAEAALCGVLADTSELWDENGLFDCAQLADWLTSSVLALNRTLSPERVEHWLASVLEVGLARTPETGSATAPLVLPTRKDFMEYAGLHHAGLQEIEQAVGSVEAMIDLTVAAFVRCVEEGRLSPALGLQVGTKHRYSDRESNELGRVATYADADDLAAGHGTSRSAIFHAIRTVSSLATELSNGHQGLLPVLQLPLVAPADLLALADGKPTRRADITRWLRGLELIAMIESGDVSATMQQAHAARRVHDAYERATGCRLVIVLPVIRVEGTRPSRTHGSPLGQYEREMPSNQLRNARGILRVLGRTRLWLAETGFERGDRGTLIATPEWAARASNGMFIPGEMVIKHNSDESWDAVAGVPGQIAIDQLKLPIALSEHRRESDVYLVRARGARLMSTGTRPTLYYLCPTDLTADADAAARVCEFLRRMHGRDTTANELRDARSAAVAKPEQLLGAQGKAPAQFIARDTERQFVALGRLLRP